MLRVLMALADIWPSQLSGIVASGDFDEVVDLDDEGRIIELLLRVIFERCDADQDLVAPGGISRGSIHGCR